MRQFINEMSWFPCRTAWRSGSSSLLRCELGLTIYGCLHGALAVTFLLQGIKIRDIYTISRSLFQLIECIAITSVLIATYSLRESQHRTFGYGKRRMSVLIGFVLSFLIAVDATLRVFWALEATIYKQRMYLEKSYNLLYYQLVVGLLGCLLFRKNARISVRRFASFGFGRSSRGRKKRFSDKFMSEQLAFEDKTASEAFEVVFIHALTKVFFAATAILTVTMVQSLRFASIAEVVVALVVVRLSTGSVTRFGCILLQSAPEHLLGSIKSQLQYIQAIDGVVGYSDDHFWEEGGGHCVGTVTAKLKEGADAQHAANTIVRNFEGIVSDMTVQAEYHSKRDEEVSMMQTGLGHRSNSFTLGEGLQMSDVTASNV